MILPPPGLRRPVAGLGLVTLAAYGGWFYGFGVLVQPIADDTGWTVGVLGAAYAAAQLLAGVGATVGGRLLDERGGRVVFAVGGVGSGIALAVASTAATSLQFAVAFAVGGGLAGATGFYHATMAAARRLSPDRPALAIGPLTIIGAFASPIFLPLTAWGVGAHGWRTTLAGLAVTTGAGLVVGAAIAPGGRADDVPVGDDAGEAPSLRAAVVLAWADPRVRRLLVLAVGYGVGASILLAYQVPVMASLGLPLGTAATLAGARGLLQLLGRVGLDGIVERFGSRRPLGGAMGLAVVACLLLGGSSTVGVAVGFAVLAGAAIGAHSPLFGIHATSVLPPRHLGALVGAVQSVGGVAAAAGPLLGGLAAQATGSYLPAVGLAAVGFAVASLSMTRPRQHPPPVTPTLPPASTPTDRAGTLP
ncbi:MFS transporter [Euzebya rosea]|uniref:MFS transporter n=1 Tax=Euzebya rosea TaxID=2052804 RepID=UPI0013004A4C|nr:MFS transporter [Euzebya rosea]